MSADVLRSPRVSLACAAALSTSLLFSCAHRVVPPTRALEEAAQKADAGSQKARVLALAGFHALWLEGDADKARTRFDAAIASDSSDVWALYGQLALAQRAEQPRRAVGISLDLLERRPTHPLAAVAARVVLESTGEAPSIDEDIARRAPALLDAGLPGDAAHLLRAALLGVTLTGGAPDAMAALTDALGAPTTATLVGPFSALHRLPMAEATAPEKTGDLGAPGDGPFGPLTLRPRRFPDARLSLGGEGPEGDVYLYAVDFEVPKRQTLVLRTVTSLEHVAVIDGTPLISRLTAAQPAPTTSLRAVQLEAGTHRLLVRLAKQGQSGNLWVDLERPDGAPAGLRFTAASGPAAGGWAGVKAVALTKGFYASAETLRAALEDEAGDALARLVAIRDGLLRDRDGARTLAAGLSEKVLGPETAMLRADLALADTTLPARVARGRAARDLEAALAKDADNARARLASARLALDDGRHLDALALARGVGGKTPSPRALALESRIELALGLDAQAAQTALAAADGSCDALVLAYDLARRRDAVADTDALLARAARCPDNRQRTVEHARARGDVEAARAAWLAQLALDETQVSVAVSFAGFLRDQGRFDEATAQLEAQRRLWPRNVQVLKALGDVFDAAGKTPEALAAREAALAIDGGDLQLRRLVARAKTGRELLDAEAISTEEALASYAAAPGSEDATSAFVLDAAAIRAYPDGSMVDRVHVIQKALDQQGVQEVAEVHLPRDAVVLKLRTLKPDGRSLEAEDIEGKDAVSLPGVEKGDLVEYEYLLAHGARGPAQPGFTAGAFYFQVVRQPNARSTYVVLAPKGTGLQVDAHGLTVAPVTTEGDDEVFRHEARLMPPFIPEGGSSPNPNEWLPFVMVGAGQQGNEGLVAAYADAFLDRAQVTQEVRAFADAAAGDATGVEAVRAVYDAVMKKLSGRDAGLTVSAAASVAQDRGSRTWLLTAALRARGFDARVVAVRAFTADPAAYRFPEESLLPYVCVLVRLGDFSLWLDPAQRFAPFGELPEAALGAREAWVFPEPGRAAERLTTPARGPRQPKDTACTLTLAEDGAATGECVETYVGFDAAMWKEVLESLPPDQREQQLQAARGHLFGGADLSKPEFETTGNAVTVRYGVSARRFGRVEGDAQLVAGALTSPYNLGRRYLSTAARRTPLFIEATDAAHAVTRLKLPAGWAFSQPVGELTLTGPNGRFVRREKQTGDEVEVEEEFRLEQSRLQPSDYGDFMRFAGEVDLLQQRDVLIGRPPQRGTSQASHTAPWSADDARAD